MPSYEPSFLNSGKIIALEGDCTLIDTHLCMLPPSPKILLLPSLKDAIGEITRSDKFDAKSFVLNVYTVLSQRLKAARSFLETNASENHPKVVFMNGATITARSLCIHAITVNITAGQVKSAEAVFNYLVRDGVASLIRKEESIERDGMTETQSPISKMEDVKEDQMPSDVPELTKDLTTQDDHTLSDQEKSEDYNKIWYADTASFGSPEREREIHKYWKPNHVGSNFSTDALLPSNKSVVSELSLKLPNKPEETAYQPKCVSHHESYGDDDKIVRTTLIVPSKEVLRLRKIKAGTQITFPSPPNVSPSIPGAYLLDTEDDDRAMNDPQLKIPNNSLRVAPVITVESVVTDPPEVEETIPDASPNPSFENPAPSFNENSLISYKSSQSLKKRTLFLNDLKSSNFNIFNSRMSQSSSTHSSKGTRSSSSISLQAASVSTEENEPRVYVDKACGADQSPNETYCVENKLYSPIFELTEDLVIFFPDGTQDQILNAVLRSCQENPYQSFRFSLLPPPTRGDFDGSVHSQILPAKEDEKPEEIDASGSDPDLASCGASSALLQTRNSNKSTGSSSGIGSGLISPFISHNEKIVTFTAVNATNLITIHNNFRKLLSNYLPIGEKRFSQFYQSVSVETDRLWKPIFDRWDLSEAGTEKSPVDQIIAFGADEVVQDDVKVRIAGLIQQIGIKKSGESRSSKIDLSFLISNVMQNMNIISLSRLTNEPLSEPSRIANLLVPQLEAYFAANTSTNLLILHYLCDHLPIIYALRNVLGTSLFKIVGIVKDPISPVPKPSSPGSSKPANLLSNEAIASRNNSSPPSLRRDSELSCDSTLDTVLSPRTASIISEHDNYEAFAGVDHLLLNSATQEEIANFISKIRKSLIKKSDFYVPEPEPEPKTIIQVVEKMIPTPTYSITPKIPSRPSTHKEDTYYPERLHTPQSRRPTKSSRHNNNTSLTSPLSDFMSRRSYAPSIASSRMTVSSSIHTDIDGWDSFEIADDDSDFDEYDRMILGSKMTGLMIGRHRFGETSGKHAPRPEMASKRKALKWLGLA